MTPVPFNPFPYQEVPAEWIRSRDQWLLCLSMGLGKTVVTLQWISDRILSGQSRAALIIAPIRVCKITWPDQAARWDFSNWMTIADMRTEEGVALWESGNFDIALINPEQLVSRDIHLKCSNCEMGCVKCKEELRGLKKAKKEIPKLWMCTHGKEHPCDKCTDGYRDVHAKGFVEKFIAKRKTLPVDMLVIDESSLSRNPGAKRWNALRPYLHDTETPGGRKFVSPFKAIGGLTGTPVPNSYLDIFAQVRLIDGGKRLGKSFTRFRNAHFDSDYMGYKWTIKPGAKERIDSAIADLALVMLGEDYLDVPPCRTEDIEIDLPPKARKEYDTLEKELLVSLERGDIEALSAATLYGKLLQMTGGVVYDSEKGVHEVHDAKLDALRKLVEDTGGEPLLVLTRFRHERARLLREFPQAVQFHEDDLGRWKAGKIPMWVADPRSLSHGIDGLQLGGRMAVWVTVTDSPDTYPQTNARLVRPGQAHETTIFRILARNTVDWAVVESLRNKDNTQSGMLKALRALQRLRK